MKRGVIPGVNLARTVAPVVPANFLSRKHLFPLFETNMPGATIVAAPTGYGKTMLVAEWAHAQTRPTIWCAVDPNDSPQMFFAHIVQAVRNVLPKFGADFESERFLSPASYIDFMVREASEVKDDFNFVIPGKLSASDGYRAIGNAVPPLLAWRLADRLDELWDQIFK